MARGSHSVGTRDDDRRCAPGNQDRLVADLLPGRMRLDVPRPDRRAATISTQNDADAQAASRQALGKPDSERRLPRAANSDIADDEHRHIEPMSPQQTDAIGIATQSSERSEEPRERNERNRGDSRATVPDALEGTINRHGCTRGKAQPLARRPFHTRTISQALNCIRYSAA